MIEKVVVPNAAAVTVVLVLYGASAAVMILSRCDLVQPGLVAGGIFVREHERTTTPTVYRMAIVARENFPRVVDV